MLTRKGRKAGSSLLRKKFIGKAKNSEYASSLKSQVNALGLDERVELLDAMPQVDLAQRVTMAATLVLPTLSEGLPRVVFEAMACGTLPIASAVGGFPELIQDGVTGFLVPPGDVNALADRLR